MTGDDVIEEVLRLLLSSSREEMNELNTSVSANATTLVMKHALGSIREGALINIGLETFRVWSVNEGTKTATVRPGVNGTTSAAHTANDLVYVNPRFSRAAIFKAINDELKALSGNYNGLYQMKKVELDYNGAVTNYDLAADVLEVYDARMSVPGPELRWERLLWSDQSLADVDTFASGHSIRLNNGMPGRPVQVLYKAPFTALTATTQDLVINAGMSDPMQDIVALGVLLRLGPVREIKRNFTEQQGDPRRAEEVASGNVQNSFAAVRQLRADRIAVEAARLAQKYPLVHR